MITISKLYFIDSTLMIPTEGDPLIWYSYLFIYITSSLLHLYISKEIILPLVKPDFCHRWHLPWNSIFRRCIVWHLRYLLSLASKHGHTRLFDDLLALFSMLCLGVPILLYLPPTWLYPWSWETVLVPSFEAQHPIKPTQTHWLLELLSR